MIETDGTGSLIHGTSSSSDGVAGRRWTMGKMPK